MAFRFVEGSLAKPGLHVNIRAEINIEQDISIVTLDVHQTNVRDAFLNKSSKSKIRAMY